MLRLPPFDYRRPTTTRDAVAIVTDQGAAARLVAGGTDLWPNMKRRHQQAATVVSLMAIPDLRGVTLGKSSADLRIGATATLTEIADNPDVRARYPALVRAVNSISSPPLRNMATLGGNLCLDTRCTYYNQTEGWRRAIDYCMKEQGEICWVAPSSPRCWAHSASDSAPMLCALQARVRLESPSGDRIIDVSDLFLNDGIEYLSKRPNELLTDIYLPAASDADQCRATFWKLRRRGSIDFAVLSVAAAVWLNSRDAVEKADIFLGAVGSYPVPVPDAQESLQGRPLTEETICEAARAARRVATPMDNTDFKTQWRGLMVERYTQAALRELAGRDPQVMPPNPPPAPLPARAQ